MPVLSSYDTVTPAAGDLVTGLQGGANVNYAVEAVAALAVPVYCRAVNIFAQTIPDAETTYLTFVTATHDNDGMFDAGTDNTKLTIQTDGVYIFHAFARLSSDPNGVREIRIELDGPGAPLGNTTISAPSEGECALWCQTPPAALNAGEYIQVNIWQTSGSALTTHASNILTSLVAVRIGPLP